MTPAMMFLAESALFAGLVDWEIRLITYELQAQPAHNRLRLILDLRINDPNHLQSMQYKDCLPE